MPLPELITTAEQRAADRGGPAPGPPPEIQDAVYAVRGSAAEGEVLTFAGGRPEWKPPLLGSILDATKYLEVGLADNTAAMSAALDDANAAGKPLWVPSRDIVTGPIVKAYAPNILSAGGRIISKAGTTGKQALWSFEGSLAAAVNTTAALAEGDTVVPVPTAGIAAGDTIIIGENTLYDATGLEANRFVGCQARVRSIDSGAQLTVYEPMYRAFANGAKVRKVNALLHPQVHGLRFLNAGAADPANYLGGLWIKYGVAVDVDIETEGMTAGGLRLYSCYDFRARLRATHHVWNQGTGQFGYGMDAIAACTHGRAEVHAQDSAEAFTTNGWDADYGEPLHVSVTGSHHGANQGGFSTHPGGRWINFHNLDVSGAGLGVSLRCRDATVRDSRIVRTTGAGTYGKGIWVFDSADGAVIENNDIAYTGRMGISVNRGLTRGRIVGNRFRELGEGGIVFNDAGVSDWTIERNEFVNVGRAQVGGGNRCIRFVATATDCTVANNHSHDSTGDPNKATKHLCESSAAGSARIKCYGNVAHDGLTLGTAQGTSGITARFNEVKIDAAGAANTAPAYP